MKTPFSFEYWNRSSTEMIKNLSQVAIDSRSDKNNGLRVTIENDHKAHATT